jgi:hypothetical protein
LKLFGMIVISAASTICCRCSMLDVRCSMFTRYWLPHRGPFFRAQSRKKHRPYLLKSNHVCDR